MPTFSPTLNGILHISALFLLVGLVPVFVPTEQHGETRKRHKHGRTLADMLLSRNVVVINDGQLPFFLSRIIESVVDLKITTPDERLLWLSSPETWENDHVAVRSIVGLASYNAVAPVS